MTKQSSGKRQTTPSEAVAPRGQQGLAGAWGPPTEGVAATSDATVERALGIARDAHDAKTMRDLRARLDDMMEREGAQALTRDSALALLRAISDGLKPSTDLFLGGEELLLVNHPALDLLEELIDVAVNELRPTPARKLKYPAGIVRSRQNRIVSNAGSTQIDFDPA